MPYWWICVFFDTKYRVFLDKGKVPPMPGFQKERSFPEILIG
jgi:hypothetical protein